MTHARLTLGLLETLRLYADTSDGRFMQGMSGASALMAMGLLKWRGDQYGSHFYSITEAGRLALSKAGKEPAEAGAGE